MLFAKLTFFYEESLILIANLGLRAFEGLFLLLEAQLLREGSLHNSATRSQ